MEDLFCILHMADAGETERLLPLEEQEEKTIKVTFITILLAKTLESVAFLTVKLSLIFYLTKEPLCWPSKRATTTVLMLSTLTYSVGFLVSLVLKPFSRSFTIIFMGYIVYILGYLYFPVLNRYTENAYDFPNETLTKHEASPCNASWTPPAFCSPHNGLECDITAHVFIAIMGTGAGLLHTNLPLFGSDQIKHGSLKLKRWLAPSFYLVRNIASLFVCLGVTVLQMWNFFSGFCLSFSFLVLSFICFLAGTENYRIINDYQLEREITSPREVADAPCTKPSVPSTPWWKICIAFLFLLPYWICFSQMNFTGFLLQGLHLRLDYRDDKDVEWLQGVTEMKCPSHPSKSFPWDESLCQQNFIVITSQDLKDVIYLPPAAFAAANGVAVVILLPVIHGIIHRLSDQNPLKKVWVRLWLGMLMATLSLVAAGTLEYIRRKNIYHCGFHRHVIGKTVYEVSPDVMIWWQIPQYILLGASEILVIVTGLQYSSSTSANKVELVTGLFWLTAAIGNGIGATLPYIFQTTVIWKIRST